MKRVTVLIAMAVVGLALASGAFASSLTSGHGSKSGVAAVLTATTKPKAPAPKAVVKAKTLPFTGVGLGGFAVAGAALVGLGVALRRASRNSA